MDLVAPVVGTLAQAYATQSAEVFTQTLPLGPGHGYYEPLSSCLQSIPESQLSPAALSRLLQAPLPKDEMAILASFLAATFTSLRLPIREDAEGSYARFKAMVAVHAELQRLYCLQDGDGYKNAFLNALMLQTCRRVYELSNTAASLSPHPMRDPASPRSIRDAARQALEKTLQISAAHQSPAELSTAYNVGDILWPLANILWRTYAQRRLHTQATELQRTFNGLQPAEDARLRLRAASVNAASVGESYYWRGRLGVVLLDFRRGKRWLEMAWDRCPGAQQRRAILVRLLACAVLCGQMPRAGVLEEFGLVEAYGPLLSAFRAGDVARWRRLLAERREWLRARNVWLLLFERGEILVWRNLFRHALVAYYASTPDAAKNRCPTDVFLSAAQYAFAGSGELEDGTVVLEDVICVLSSLIDQNLVKGVLSYSQRQLAMKPSPDGMGGFPRLRDVEPRKVHAIA